MLPKDGHGTYKHTTTIDANEWILMHKIDIQPLCIAATSLLVNKKRKDPDGDTFVDEMSDLVFEAFIPWNPMVVVLTRGLRVFLYNLESKSIEFVQHRGRPIPLRSSFGMRPFVESLSLSSYALSGNTCS